MADDSVVGGAHGAFEGDAGGTFPEDPQRQRREERSAILEESEGVARDDARAPLQTHPPGRSVTVRPT